MVHVRVTLRPASLIKVVSLVGLVGLRYTAIILLCTTEPGDNTVSFGKLNCISPLFKYTPAPTPSNKYKMAHTKIDRKTSTPIFVVYLVNGRLSS